MAYPLTNTVLPNLLFFAAEDYSTVTLMRFIVGEWQDMLKRELIHNLHGFLPVSLPEIAQDLPIDFPSPVVVKCLATPLRHQSTSSASGNVDVDSLCSSTLACGEACDHTSEDEGDNDEAESEAADWEMDNDESGLEAEDIAEVERCLICD